MEVSYASAGVENVVQLGTVSGNPLYNLMLNPSSLNGEFVIPQQTVLNKIITATDGPGDLITVDSTFGWRDQNGVVVINGELIKYKGKSSRQFTIDERGAITQTHNQGDLVVSHSTAKAKTSQGDVTVLVYGILSDLEIAESSPYSVSGDRVQISKPGFETRDPIMYDEYSQNYRWKVNLNAVNPSVPLNPVIATSLSDYIADISAVYEDEQYYYIATSSYPSTDILTGTVNETLIDPKLLKLIPKETTTTTEVYETPKKEVGVFVDGSIAYNVKDEETIEYGPITKFTITKRGSGYQKPPYVLLNGVSGKAEAILTGDSVTSIISTNTESYTASPLVEITSGRNALLAPIVTTGELTSLQIVNPGEYYSSPPVILISDINGKGRFAQYTAVISTDGKIIDTIKVDGGKFYTQDGIRVTIIPDALNNGAEATSTIYEWVKNRYYDNSQNIDDNGGIVVTNSDNESHYGVVGNPRQLRYRLGDNLTSITLQETATLTHSPILGYAYDGHPIYGPYGHSDPLDKDSSIVRLKSGYSLKATRSGGPVQDIGPYPLGTFVDDYEWVADIESGITKLDRNNGRFCVTPEYPSGVYAYFLTIDSNQNSVYPHIIGKNYYSVPVASNYNFNVKQDSVPLNAKRLYIEGSIRNGSGEIGIIDDISTGSVSGVTIEDSQPVYGIGSKIYVDDISTGGSGASGLVDSTYGNPVLSIESKDTKATLLTTVTPLYSFAGDLITQASTGAVGELLRDTIEETEFVVRDVQGTFDYETLSGISNSTKTISSSSTVVKLLLDQDSTYSKDAVLSLVLKDDIDTILAKGRVIVTTKLQNSVRLELKEGDFDLFSNYPVGDPILKSTDLSNTAGTSISVVTQLSKNLVPVGVDESIAILHTDGDHNFGEGDTVNIDIDPEPSATESTYWVRRKKFQELELIPPGFNSKLNDTGIGSSSLLNYGRDYVAGTYNDVELVFSNYTTTRSDVVNAKATIVVNPDNWDGSGQISSIQITDGGSGYTRDDILTINPSAIVKVDPSTSSVNSDVDIQYTNQSIVESYLQKKFTVDASDWTTITNYLDNTIGLGQPFQDDSGTKEFYYLGKDDSTYKITYAFYLAQNTNDLVVGDTIQSASVTDVLMESPIGSPLPQYRFEENGVINPDYQIRVGSTFTFDALADHPVRIIMPGYQTSLGTDFVALVLDSYTDAPGVNNQGATTGDITWTPSFEGVFYYINTDHPEAVGKITVLPGASPAIPLLGIYDVGFGVDRTDAILESVYGLSNNDLLKINSEIVEVVSIDSSTRKVTFSRGKEGTNIVNHPVGSKVDSHNANYRFVFDDKVFGDTINDPRVISYENNKLLVAFDFLHEGATNLRQITETSSLFDHSTPTKQVSISKAYDKVEKLQFSPDNTNFETNPVLQIQKYYFYKFDTSHPSMLGSYLDISTSPNYNIFTEEKQVTLTEPGNNGANIRIRLGYGPNIGDVKRKTVNFISYYYFLTTEDIDTGGSYLKVFDDPLSGKKDIIYTTDNKFVYRLDSEPQYDGTGGMRYTGKSIGKIATVTLDNLGFGYKSLPSIIGVVPSESNKATVECVRDIVSQKITELVIINPGSNYVNPKAVIASGDGEGLQVELTTVNGSIAKAEIIKSGSGYTYTPTLDIVESDNKLFFKSTDIGSPQSVRFVRYGSGYHNDNSVLPYFTTPYILTLSNFDEDAFNIGERVEQRVNNVVIASGIVDDAGWRPGLNVLKLRNVEGVFKEGTSIINKQRGKTATVLTISTSKFTPVVNTREKRIGKFTSDRGKISSTNQRITDSDFYQDYSYVIRSRTPINDWRNAIKDTTHPAGFKLFGEVYLESEGSGAMVPEQPETRSITTYLCIPPATITSSTVKRTITETFVNTESLNIRRGVGSIAIDSFDETLTRVRELTLSPAFDGSYDPSSGLKIGTSQFTLIDKKTGTAYTPYNEQELMVSLDGIVQQPINSYTVSGNQIKFYEPPLGPRVNEGAEVPPQKIYCRAFKFRENPDNVRYLKRLKDISDQFDGREKNFDLYWEDGSIVKTDLNENLLIYLDAVLQQDSYTIRRFVSANKTDRLIFKKAPLNYADLYSDMPESLQNEQYFYGQSVGSYERLHIDQSVVPFSPNNSYLILDSNGSVKTFDDDHYAYVFVNGVLQRDTESYRIAGPSIIFNNSLEYALQSDGSYTTAKVDILYFYGKDYEPTLTFFDFEADVYYNRTTITFDGSGTYDTFNGWYGPESGRETKVYQIIGGVKKDWGKIIAVQQLSGDQWSLVIKSQNIEYIDGDKVYISRSDTDIIELSVSSIDVVYNTNSSGERLLNREETNYVPWLDTSDLTDSYEYKGELLKEHPSIKKGDKILIDGEFEYREILSSPLFAKTKEYNIGEQVSNSFFAKVKSTAYNGDVYGEGFTVTAKISNGVVNELIWNKRDLLLYFQQNILLNPTAYNYYTPPVVNFIPTDGNGGGARAQVLVHGGAVLGIELIDGGKGYTSPPKVVIARGYDIIRTNDTFESSIELYLHDGGYDGISATLAGASSEDFLWRRELIEHETSLVSPHLSTLVTLHRQSTPILNPAYVLHKNWITKTISPTPPDGKAISSGQSYINSSIQPSALGTTYQTYIHPVTKHISTGIIDMLEQPVENGHLFEQGKLGGTVASFMEYLFMDNGSFNVSGINIEQFTTFYPFLAINQNPGNWMENYTIDYSSITSNGVLFNPGIPSIHDHGGFLDLAINDTDLTLYITGSTTHFPPTGKLLVGKEIVEYDGSINNDRFTLTARGVDGTEPTSHNQDDYFRTVGKYN